MPGTLLLSELPETQSMTCICCNCQRERFAADDWREHSPLPGERLTHGICPDCVHELYPDIASLVLGN
jgi:hypothetical protein